MHMHIVPLCTANLHDAGKCKEPFPVFGRIVPALKNGIWTYTEELFDELREKQYPDEETDYRQYIGAEDRAVFLAYDGKTLAGQITLRAEWNRYALVEELFVAGAARRKGIGTALLREAEKWAREREICGLSIETQDNNLAACRLYAKCGFAIGGVNNMLYRNFGSPIEDETAIFWYKRF